jgi:hypothetical protein
MGCPHEFAERVKDLEPVWVGDLYSNVDVYFCEDCGEDFACLADTFKIVSALSMGTDLHDAASDAGIEVSDGRF